MITMKVRRGFLHVSEFEQLGDVLRSPSQQQKRTKQKGFGAPISEEERDAQRERAFGMLKKKSKPRTEWQEHLDVARYMREHHAHIRFYSTFDGFYLGSQYAKAIPLRWSDPNTPLDQADKNGDGVPDLFIFYNNGVHTMLVIELKREDVSIKRKDGKLRQNAHFKRQYEWLRYLESMGAQCHFASGATEAIELIKKYINGTGKRKNKK